jgi:hypothetical protein
MIGAWNFMFLKYSNNANCIEYELHTGKLNVPFGMAIFQSAFIFI